MGQAQRHLRQCGKHEAPRKADRRAQGTYAAGLAHFRNINCAYGGPGPHRILSAARGGCFLVDCRLTSAGRADTRVQDLLAAWPDDPAAFRTICQRCGTGADWEQLRNAALRHGVLGVLARPLAELGSGLPAETRIALQAHESGGRLWHAHLRHALDQALAALATAAVPTVALKGPVLSERLFGEPWVRPSIDIDLLVDEANLERASAALETTGYQTPGGAQTRYYRQHHHHLVFQRLPGPRIELHFRLYTGFGATIRADAFIERSRLYDTTWGARCRILAPEDELFFLSIHAAAHQYERLAWLYDLKTFVRHWPDLNWSRLFAAAEAARVGVALSFTVEMLQRRLRFSVPAARQAANRYCSRWHAPARLLRMCDQLPPESRREKLSSLLLQALLCDRWGSALWVLQHHLLRVCRRRLRRFFPSLVPSQWSG